MQKVVRNISAQKKEEIQNMIDAVKSKCDIMTKRHLNKIKVKEVKNESIEPGTTR